MKNVGAYKTIGEVAKQVRIETHILRSWEESFVQVKPLKRNGGRRLYSEADISIIRTIKKMIYEEGYTIKGAKKHLAKKKIVDVIKEGQIIISEDLDLKLNDIKGYLVKAKEVLKNES